MRVEQSQFTRASTDAWVRTDGGLNYFERVLYTFAAEQETRFYPRRCLKITIVAARRVIRSTMFGTELDWTPKRKMLENVRMYNIPASSDGVFTGRLKSLLIKKNSVGVITAEVKPYVRI